MIGKAIYDHVSMQLLLMKTCRLVAYNITYITIYIHPCTFDVCRENTECSKRKRRNKYEKDPGDLFIYSNHCENRFRQPYSKWEKLILLSQASAAPLPLLQNGFC